MQALVVDEARLAHPAQADEAAIDVAAVGIERVHRWRGLAHGVPTS